MITLSGGTAGIHTGDVLDAVLPEYRWWMQVWRRLTFRDPRIRKARLVVVNVTQNSIHVREEK